MRLKDRCQTPPYATELLLPYLPHGATIWEPAAGRGYIVATLRRAGWSVISGDIQTGQDYFHYQPAAYDVMVTNPPYDREIIDRWIARAYDLGKPWALLMKTSKLHDQESARLFARFGVGLVQPVGRVDYLMPVANDWKASSAQFGTTWFTWGLGVEGIVFAEMDKRTPAMLESGPVATVNGRWGQLGF